ncbi:hypothetical protein [Thiopseudomonas denitrificans]|uniref:Uncharacterized protein n=1 Tax=Thiopseudomonas denitrificans TaxID=1501432 RepID=A0A4R6TXQ1_9GAMM|nr:hypothetical protein [Thiopseudomonas denitrificans]TDQ37572.1 hypothetical protein DFQ45_10778 [Thiopseudomonas denitrificans]
MTTKTDIDRIDEMTAIADYLGWMNAITWAAAQAAKDGRSTVAYQLASAAQYLTMDQQAWVDDAIRRQEGMA